MSNTYYEKDEDTKAILNTNKVSYIEYKQKRREANRVESIENKIKCLSNEIGEIKELMYKFIKGR